MKRSRPQREPKDRGAALVLVLWGAVVMAIIAAAAARQASVTAVVVNAGSELTRARALSEAGIRSAWSAFADGRIDDLNAVWGCREGQDALLVRVRQESARIDINLASKELLSALYRGGGASEDLAVQLADETLEYRHFAEGADDSGAQVVEGTARQPEGTFRRGPFQAVEELGYLPGMDATLYRAISDDISVLSRTSDIDLDESSPLVKKAFDEASREDVGSVARADPTPPGDTTFEGTLMNVRATAVTASGAIFIRDAVVEGPFDSAGTPTILRLVQDTLRPHEQVFDASSTPACSQGFTRVAKLQ